jgi:DNA repair exonuclease SbcCD nuclease subunit
MSDLVLIFSDLHVHCHKKSHDRLRDCLKVLRWVFETARQREIKKIVFCGDLFHDRQKIDVIVYNETFRVMEEYLSDGKTELHLLLGNHDLWHSDKWNVSSVRPLAALPGVHVVDEVCSIPINGVTFDFLPYTSDPIKHLEVMGSGRRGRVLCAHLAIDGAQLNARFNTRADVQVEHDGDMVKVSADIFRGWDQVFLGHYHGEQKIADNAEYVGSPLQLSFGEAFQQKHIIVYDVRTRLKEYVINNFSPQHLVIPVADLDKYPLDGNFVRVEVADLGATSVADLRNEIVKSAKVGSLEIKAADKKEPDRAHIVEDAKAILFKEDEMLERYIDEVGTDGLDRDRLLGVGRLVCTPLTEEELESTT